MRIIVLGTGMVGSAIVKDLAQDDGVQVTAVDRDANALARLSHVPQVRVQQADLGDPAQVTALVAEYDLAISAVPGFMGFATLRAVLEAGKNVVDISFFPEDAFLLDELARSRGVTAVVDCGVAPGLCNIIAGRVDTLLDQTHSYTCYVGGLPQIRRWPFEYKAGFSPADVLEEYTRPARFIEHGHEVVRPALSDIELRDFPGIGTLEAFNTDGLRTLMRTLDIPTMREKTLRYPGHANLMRILRESGFFDAAPIDVHGQPVSPLALTSRLLFDQWRYAPDEADLTIMQVILEGQQDGQPRRYTYDLLDRYDAATQTSSMARTTGYTCTLIARQVMSGLVAETGICPPELIGRAPACYAALLAGYEERGIHLRVRSTTTRITH